MAKIPKGNLDELRTIIKTRTPTGTGQGVWVELTEQGKKELVGELEEEDGALTVAVELIILHFVGENVFSVIVNNNLWHEQLARCKWILFS